MTVGANRADSAGTCRKPKLITWSGRQKNNPKRNRKVHEQFVMVKKYDYKTCGAKTRAGGKCKQRAMANGRCYLHGGKSLSGIASPHWKTGRWSKYIPKDLAENYTDALEDSDPLSLTDDIALLRAMISKHLVQMGQGDTHPAWIEAYQAYRKIDQAVKQGQAEKLLTALAQLEAIISPHSRAARAEQKVSGYIDQVGRIADKDRRLLIDRQRMLTIEQAMALLTAVVMGIRESVLKHCERATATKILTDTNTAYSRAIGSGNGDAVIDDR